MTLDIHRLQKKLGVTDKANAFLILRDLHEGVIIVDVHGEILYYNKAMAKIDDFEMAYPLGKKITEVYQLSAWDSTTMSCIRTGKPIKNRVIMYRTRLGKMSNVISNVFPLFKDGVVVGAISFTKDYQMLETLISSGKPSKVIRGQGNGTRYTFSDMVGENGGLFNAVKTAKMACDSPSPIMLSGETGTGKELFAQSIHNHGKNSRHKFIPINCAAIPENLLEGILFGTSRGAFTGAIEKSGLFEQANGGTIFLDELDSMPITLQAKLLRVVQEKRVRRLGSLEEIPLQIKIISAVCRDPREIIESGSLRQDLFYRMGVVFIMIPPLRERRGDMDQLVTHFIKKFNKSLGERVTGLSRRVSNLFLVYHWPGNVRELEHVIEGAMNMVNGEKLIRLTHLPIHLRNSLDNAVTKGATWPDIEPLAPLGYGGHEKLAESGDVTPGGEPPSLSDVQNANERHSLCKALQRSGGNAAGAARMLGISPQSLHYKLKKFKINRKDFIGT